MNDYPILRMSIEHQAKVLADPPLKWSTLRTAVAEPGIYRMEAGRGAKYAGVWYPAGSSLGLVEVKHQPRQQDIEILGFYDQSFAAMVAVEPIRLIVWSACDAKMRQSITICEGYGVWHRDTLTWTADVPEFERVAEAFYPRFISGSRPLYLHWLQQVKS